jgi:predicted enzyme related to lactoylglutathione lyase
MTIDFDFDPNAVLVDSTTDIEGVNHIGLSVQNLDRVLEFYRAATGFEVSIKNPLKMMHRPTLSLLATM